MILKLKPNAYNSIADKIRNDYFGGIKWHHDHPDCSKAVYQVELFSNGCITLKVLEIRLSKICKIKREEIASMLSEFYTFDVKTPYKDRVRHIFEKFGIEKIDLEILSKNLGLEETNWISRRKIVVKRKALLFVCHLHWGEKSISSLNEEFGFSHSIIFHYIRKFEKAVDGFDDDLKNFIKVHLERARCD